MTLPCFFNDASTQLDPSAATSAATSSLDLIGFSALAEGGGPGALTALGGLQTADGVTDVGTSGPEVSDPEAVTKLSGMDAARSRSHKLGAHAAAQRITRRRSRCQLCDFEQPTIRPSFRLIMFRPMIRPVNMCMCIPPTQPTVAHGRPLLQSVRRGLLYNPYFEYVSLLHITWLASATRT